MKSKTEYSQCNYCTRQYMRTLKWTCAFTFIEDILENLYSI